ncbi:hypothetical protein CR513_60767, partial [Mucuna pruriens]
MYVIGVVCRFMESPTFTHMKATKRILRYLKCTLDFGLFYSSSKEFKLMEFCDNDFTGDVDDRKNTTDFIFLWVIVFLLETLKRKLLKEFNMNQEESTKIHIDNKSVQVLVKNLVFHERSKHIDTRECIVKKDVELVHVKIQDQITDIFIKPLKFENFRRLRARLCV